MNIKNLSDSESRQKKKRRAQNISKGLAKFHMKKPEESVVELAKKEKDAEKKIKDSEEFQIEATTGDDYQVTRDGNPVYQLEKKDKNYTCSCTGFKYRGNCKHVEALKAKIAAEDKNPAPVDPTKQRHPRSEFERFIPELTEICEPFDKWEIVGSWIRKKPTFKDVDVIALGKDGWDTVHKNLEESGAWDQIMYGPTIMRGMYHGYYLDFNLCPSEENWVWWLLYRTGSKDLNIEMRRRAITMGYALSESPLTDRYTFEEVPIKFESEKEIFEFLGFEYLEPEEREPENLKTLDGWVLEDHKSEGLKAIESGDFDWSDYLKSVMSKVQKNPTYVKQAKYPLRLAVVVARELARRTRVPVESILKNVNPLDIQPGGPKRGQQTWDKDGAVFVAS